MKITGQSIDVSLLEQIKKSYEHVIDDYKNDIARSRVKVIEPAVDELLQENDISVDKNSVGYRKLCREVLKANVEYFKIGLERYKGNYDNKYDSGIDSLIAPVVAPVLVDEGKLYAEVVNTFFKE